MTNVTGPVQAIGKIREPKALKDRERRPINGLAGKYEITRTGAVFSVEHDEFLEVDRWPYIGLLVEDGVADVNTVHAVAMAWLSPEQRAQIRATLPKTAKHGDPEVTALEEHLQVSKHAIASVGRSESDDGIPVLKLEVSTGERHRVELQPFSDYTAFLVEKYRSPAKGGNTSALHVHRLKVDGEHYTFFARGSRMWAYKGDRVSFDYVITPEGYRNILRDTFRVVDKNSKPVIRGDHRSKQTLRTATQRAPVSRREWRS